MGYIINIINMNDNRLNFNLSNVDEDRAGLAGGVAYHLPPDNPKQHRQTRRRIVLGAVSTLAVAILSTVAVLAIGHFSLVSTCERSAETYQQQLTQLQKLVDDNRQTAKITTDEVDSDSVALVNDFQSSYKQAKGLLADAGIDDDQCRSNHRNAELTQTISDLTNRLNKLSRLVDRISTGGVDVTAANHTKQLSDAKTALRSTILSVQSLSQNQSLSATTRTQLNQAVATASGLLGSDDLDDIVSARRQMDDIVDQVNNALSSTNAALLDIEKKVSAVPSQASSDGSYTAAAVKIINTAGLKEVWGLGNMRGACSITNEQAASWIAAFCSATPNNVYINNQLGSTVMGDTYFADAMRHEVAHYLIYRRCGTSEPASIGSQANAESTASSYAVLYLGANPNTLNRAGDDRYHMNQASDEAAARIHAGQCRAN